MQRDTACSGRTGKGRGDVVALYIKNVHTCSEVLKEVGGRAVESLWVKIKVKKWGFCRGRGSIIDQQIRERSWMRHRTNSRNIQNTSPGNNWGL